MQGVQMVVHSMAVVWYMHVVCGVWWWVVVGVRRWLLVCVGGHSDLVQLPHLVEALFKFGQVPEYTYTFLCISDTEPNLTLQCIDMLDWECVTTMYVHTCFACTYACTYVHTTCCAHRQ